MKKPCRLFGRPLVMVDEEEFNRLAEIARNDALKEETAMSCPHGCENPDYCKDCETLREANEPHVRLEIGEATALAEALERLAGGTTESVFEASIDSPYEPACTALVKVFKAAGRTIPDWADFE